MHIHTHTANPKTTYRSAAFESTTGKFAESLLDIAIDTGWAYGGADGSCKEAVGRFLAGGRTAVLTAPAGGRGC